jgi:hypothetical protein
MVSLWLPIDFFPAVKPIRVVEKSKQSYHLQSEFLLASMDLARIKI